MNCHDAGIWVTAYADGELGRLHGYSLRRHLRGCAACTERHQSLLALRARLREEVPYFKAPPELRARLQARFADMRAPVATGTRPQRDHWLWLSAGALAGCTATVLTWLVSAAVVDWSASRDLAAEAVAMHTRAVLSDRLIQVASS